MSKPNRFNSCGGYIDIYPQNPREVFQNQSSIQGHQTIARIRWVKLSKGPHKDAIRSELGYTAINQFPSKSGRRTMRLRSMRKSKMFN